MVKDKARDGVKLSALMLGLHATALAVISGSMLWLSTLISTDSPLVKETVTELISDPEFIEFYGEMTLEEGVIWVSGVFQSFVLPLILVLMVLLLIELVTAYFVLQKKEKARWAGLTIAFIGMVFPALLFLGNWFFFLANFIPGAVIVYYLAFDKKTMKLFK